jgi:YHS domain-containing protein
LESGADGVLGSSDYTSTITDTDGNSYSFYFSTEANKELFEASPTSYLPKVVVKLLLLLLLLIDFSQCIRIESTEVFVLGELQKRVGGLKTRLDQRKCDARIAHTNVAC